MVSKIAIDANETSILGSWVLLKLMIAGEKAFLLAQFELTHHFVILMFQYVAMVRETAS